MSEHILLAALLVALWCWHEWRIQQRLRRQYKEVQRLQRRIATLQARVSRREKRLDTVLANINEAVLRLNGDGTVRGCNVQARRVFAIAEHAMFPLPLTAIYRDPDWHRHFNEALRRLPEDVSLPAMHVREHVLHPRLARLGKKQLLLVCMDVTQEHVLQQQRNQFLSNLMHDLKTPLTSLLGYARSMQTFASDEALRHEAVEVIVNEARHINHLLDSLLCIDQIEHGQRLHGECDLTALLQVQKKSFEPQLSEKAVQLSLHVPASVVVPMHEVDCTRILRNILSNAIRHSPPGGEISCRMQQASEGEQPVLIICDQGEGIPDADLPHVCERFYRVDSNRQRGGHGLGLAIVHELMNRDGGKLELSANTPHGLCVRLVFPAVPPNDSHFPSR